MTDFEAANDAEAARNNTRSPQRGSVTENVDVRRNGEIDYSPGSPYPREGSLGDDTDDPEEGEDSDEPDWGDPNIEGQFAPYHRP